MPPLKSVSRRELRRLRQAELLSLHRRAHQQAPRLFPDLVKAEQPLSAVRLLQVHRWLQAELERRGLNHVPHDLLDFYSAQTPVFRGPIAGRPGLYLMAPHGLWLVTGYKRLLIKSRSFQLGRPLVVVSGRAALGLASFDEPKAISLTEFRRLRDQHRISEQERRAWWPKAEILYAYEPRQIARLPKPQAVALPQGVQTLIRHVVLAKAEPRPAALAFVVSPDHHLLAIHRRNPPRVWSPPGGFLSGDVEASARQELEEETGIHDARLVGRLPKIELDGQALYPVVFQAPGRLEIALNQEADAFRWLTVEELADLDELSPAEEIWRAALALVAKAEQPRYRHEALAMLHHALPDEVVVVPDWLSVSGGMVYGRDREPHDLDLINRHFDMMPEGSRLKFERLFNFLTGKQVHWVPEDAGPTWPAVPLFDLVARKRPTAELITIDEPQFAGLMYKANLVTSASAIKPGKPLAQYKTAGEYYVGDEEALWDKFVRRAAERGVPVAVQEKYDGVRLMVHRLGNALKVFSDKGFERSHLFPDLAEALPEGEYILDAEFMQLDRKGGKPVERWEMAWMGGAKAPPDPYPPLWIAVHDLPFWDKAGGNLADKPYTERLKLLEKLLGGKERSQGPYRISVAETKLVKSEPELKRALAWARNRPGSEGAMLKLADFRYAPKLLGDVVKYKRAVEIDALIIGYRKLPKPKPAGAHWDRQEALRRLPQQLAASNTYIFRLAVKDGKRLVPIESDGTLTPKDVKIDWDEERQRYTGTDDPRLWTMWHGFKERKVGEYRYGNTYALRVDPKQLKPGAIVTVAPVKVRLFRKKDGSLGLATMFPRAKQLKPAGSPVAQLKEVLRAFGVKKPEEGGEIAKAAPSIFSTSTYPAEDKPHRFVAQLHFRGRSVHLDLRLGISPDTLEGWTVSVQQPGKIKAPVLSLKEARATWRDPENWKLNNRTAEILPRRVLTTIRGQKREIVRPGALRALRKKAEIPAAWLDVEGATDKPDPGERPPVGGTRHFPGVFLIIDKGRVHFGARRPWFFEYFLEGEFFKGRYVFRAVGRTAKAAPTARDVHRPASMEVLPRGQAEEGSRAPFYWVLMKPKDQTPYVLSDEAVRKNWLPPKGVSALPPAIRRKVPASLRYWEVSGKEALERRRKLAQEYEELAGAAVEKGLRQPFGSPGGKNYMAGQLVDLIPPHRLYCEPFAGGAALFFRKEPSEEEVLADTHPDLIATLRFLRDASQADLKRLAGRDWVGSETRFNQLLKAKPTGPLERAYRFLYLSRFGWLTGGRFDKGQFRHSSAGKRSSLASFDRLQALQERLKGVRILRQDALKTIQQVDSPETFFFIDPPYLKRHDALWEEEQDAFGEQDWRRLVDHLKKLKGRFMLTMNQGTYAALAPWPKGWWARRIRTRHPLTPGNNPEPSKANRRQIEEVLVANFEPAAKAGGMPFVLQRHWWRGPIVIRFGPSSEHYDLRLQEKPGQFYHLVLNGDPRKKTVAAYEKPMGGKDVVEDAQGKRHHLMALRGRISLQPGTAANPTKETPAFIETIDFGTARWLEREQDRAKIELKGKQGSHTLFLHRESADSPFWEVGPSPGPRVEKEGPAEAYPVEIAKLDDEKRLAYGVVLKPRPFVDSQGDLVPAEEIEQAAHRFLIHSRLIDLEHKTVLPPEKARPVESYIAPQDITWRQNGSPPKHIPAGSWVLVTHIPDDALWQRIKRGELRAYSIRGFGVRKRLTPAKEVSHV